MLSDKSIANTMKYIHTIEFKEEDYEETVAITREEKRQLGKAGWAKYDELTVNGMQMHFYRKPKRFWAKIISGYKLNLSGINP